MREMKQYFQVYIVLMMGVYLLIISELVTFLVHHLFGLDFCVVYVTCYDIEVDVKSPKVDWNV